MKWTSPPKLSTCIIVYYVALLLFGIIGTAMAPTEHSMVRVLGGGLWIVFVTHVFFGLAIEMQGDWLSYVLVAGIPIAITISVMKLTGWLRNAAVIGLLFTAHAYGLAVAGMNS